MKAHRTVDDVSFVQSRCDEPASILASIVTLLSSIDLHAWGGQGHRLVGLIAAERLTPIAKQNVAWLLDGQTLADVSSWADSLTSDQVQTSYWHYLNIPPDATGYDRDRDCPKQPGVAAGIAQRSLARLRRRSHRVLGRAARRCRSSIAPIARPR